VLARWIPFVDGEWDPSHQSSMHVGKDTLPDYTGQGRTRISGLPKNDIDAKNGTHETGRRYASRRESFPADEARPKAPRRCSGARL
jgi:hypothetical protein